MTPAGRIQRNARRVVIVAAAVVAVAAPTVLAAARWPRWWSDIAPEQTPMTWLQSVVLTTAAAASALAAVVDFRRVRLWLLLAAGFLALAIDERFALHERLRDNFLAPRGVALPFLPWVAPGDFLLLVGAVAGLLLLPHLLPLFRYDRSALRALWLGVACAALAVGVDSVDPQTWTIAQERVQQSLEECLELISDLSLCTAIALRLIGLNPPAVPAADRSDGHSERVA